MAGTTATNQPESGLSAHGVLRREVGDPVFRLKLYEPHPDLRPWVEYYWAVAWDLGDAEFVQTVVTNPTVDLSFENDVVTNGDHACVVATGVVPRSYQRVLRGRGDVFAAHFHPGMFRPWWGRAVSDLTGRAETLGPGHRAWETAAHALRSRVLAAPNEERVAVLDELLLERRPPHDPVAEEICDLVLLARDERALWSTGELARRRAVSPRTNQRAFLEYVGVSPGWVARRYRIQAAIEALDRQRERGGEPLDLTGLAVDLGYYDAAHFGRDFRAVTGATPSSYRQGS
jgi:AraC-like DNA-binding protein